MTTRRLLVVALAGVLIGLAASWLSPQVYETVILIRAGNDAAYGVPPSRLSNLLRQAIRRPGETDALGSCMREVLNKERDPWSRTVSGEYDLWLQDLASTAFRATSESSFGARRWALGLGFSKGGGYLVELFTRRPGDVEPLLGILPESLACWISGFDDREGDRRQADFEKVMGEIEQEVEIPPLPTEEEAARLERVLGSKISRLEEERGLPPAPRQDPSDYLARWGRLLRQERPPLDPEARERFQAELLTVYEMRTQQRARARAQQETARGLLLANYRRTFHLPESLPPVGDELRVLKETARHPRLPPVNAIFFAWILLALCQWLADRSRRAASRSLG